jgi:hypothetical protein
MHDNVIKLDFDSKSTKQASPLSFIYLMTF